MRGSQTVKEHGELLACSYCGGRFASHELAGHKEAQHGILEENCKRSGQEHGPLVVVVDAGRVHILSRGGTTMAPIVPEEGWASRDAPEELRKIIEKENGALVVRDGGFLPRTRASLEALERIYHELAAATPVPGPGERPRTEGVLARYLRERWKEAIRVPGSVGELQPTGVGAAASHASGDRVTAAKADAGGLRRCRACDAVLTGPECAMCGLRNG